MESLLESETIDLFGESQMYRHAILLKASVVALSTLTCVGTAAATPFDGIYRPAGMDWWSCQDVGMDGGAVAVRNNVLYGVESYCELTNPTNVRGISAVLYDAVCAAEGSEYSYRVMLMTHPEGIFVVQDGFVADWRQCRN